MLQTLRIRNFRCFHDLRLDLSRLNIIAGRNNVGKTTLLEAAFLHLGPTNPRLSLITNLMRGHVDSLRDPLHTWGWFFPKRDISQDPVVESTNTDGLTRRLELSLRRPKEVVVKRGEASDGPNGESSRMTTTGFGDLQLRLSYKETRGKRLESSAKLTQEGVVWEPAHVAPHPLSVMVSPSLTSSMLDVQQFSQLEEEGRSDEVVSALQLIEPRLAKLAVSTTSAGTFMRCDVGLGRLMPLSMAGAGMCRLFNLVVALLSCRGGAVLVDEVEAGLHHASLRQVWSVVADIAERTDVQVLATTHSYECLRAAHAALSERITYDARFIRLERDGTEVTAVLLDKETMETATSSGWEIR